MAPGIRLRHPIRLISISFTATVGQPTRGFMEKMPGQESSIALALILYSFFIDLEVSDSDENRQVFIIDRIMFCGVPPYR